MLQRSDVYKLNKKRGPTFRRTTNWFLSQFVVLRNRISLHLRVDVAAHGKILQRGEYCSNMIFVHVSMYYEIIFLFSNCSWFGFMYMCTSFASREFNVAAMEGGVQVGCSATRQHIRSSVCGYSK